MKTYKQFISEGVMKNLHSIRIFKKDYWTKPINHPDWTPLHSQRIEGEHDADIQSRAKELSRVTDHRVEVFHSNPVTGERHETSYAGGMFLMRHKR